MGLSDLTLPSMELYGGIEIKKSGKRNTIRGFLTAVAIHLLLLGLYFAWTALAKEDLKKIPHVRRISSLAELAPPPSTEDNNMEAAPVAPAPTVDVAKPTFGIPVPVPDIQAPNQTMPDLNNLPVQSSTPGDGNGSGVVLNGSGNGPVHVEPPAEPVKEDIPSKDEFIDVQVEPKPVQNIQALVVYPEVAKRSGVEGKVTASVLIAKDGHVERVDIEKSDNEIFNQAAIDALKKARFTPAIQNGNPVQVWWTVPIVFRLSK
ncbi:MAG: energy transducer TonB [Bacteroidetes bacterium]|nr:energy transducer TonB [Bacteroidota bacterium]